MMIDGFDMNKRKSITNPAFDTEGRINGATKGN